MSSGRKKSRTHCSVISPGAAQRIARQADHVVVVENGDLGVGGHRSPCAAAAVVELVCALERSDLLIQSGASVLGRARVARAGCCVGVDPARAAASDLVFQPASSSAAGRGRSASAPRPARQRCRRRAVRRACAVVGCAAGLASLCGSAAACTASRAAPNRRPGGCAAALAGLGGGGGGGGGGGARRLLQLSAPQWAAGPRAAAGAHGRRGQIGARRGSCTHLLDRRMWIFASSAARFSARRCNGGARDVRRRNCQAREPAAL